MFYKTVCTLLMSCLFISPLYAHQKGLTHHHSQLHSSNTKDSLSLQINPDVSLVTGKAITIKFKLVDLNSKKSLTLRDLKEVHTKKLHLLIIDSSLSDYHHIHPKLDSKTGEFVFDFTPRKNHYRIWADITPLATNQQEYLRADIGNYSKENVRMNKTLNTVSTVDGYTFRLKLDGEVKAGQAVTGTVTVTRRGKLFNRLEPVMGAFAHVVGFSENFNSVLHVHPMGKEPTKSTDKGGPKLEFHIEPKTAGFVKLFVQVRIDGNDIFIPFGIKVH